MQKAEDFGLSFAQERLWFIDRFENGSNIYNLPFFYILPQFIDINILEKSFNSLIERHETLRTTIKNNLINIPYQQILNINEYKFKIDFFELNSLLELDSELKSFSQS